MTEPEPDPKPGLEWVVTCPEHGTRAHIYLEGLKSNPPDLLHCSELPGEFPPPCNQACLKGLTLGSEEDFTEEIGSGPESE